MARCHLFATHISLVLSKKNLSKKTVSTPNFYELKSACNSDRLEHCFRFMFMQDASENDRFVTVLEAEYEALHQRLFKYGQLVQEGRS